jgi:hypothetical protein
MQYTVSMLQPLHSAAGTQLLWHTTSSSSCGSGGGGGGGGASQCVLSAHTWAYVVRLWQGTVCFVLSAVSAEGLIG